jgi:hypothetical protein
MTSSDEILAAIEAQPFAPFIIRLADQRSFPVRSPRFIAIATDGDSLVVYDDTGLHILDTRLVTEIHYPPLSSTADLSLH